MPSSSLPSRRTTGALIAGPLALLGATVLGAAVVAPAGAEETASESPSAATHPGAPGNNGTVKVGDETDLDEQRPENDPHLPCTFDIQWFSFDSGWGPITSEVDLELHAPTDEAAGVTMTVDGDTTPTFTGNGGRPGAGAGRDHLEWYTLSFTGEPQPQQGYHVKLTVDTPHSQGNRTKSKTFWIGPCAEEEPPPASPAAGPTTAVEPPATTVPATPTESSVPTGSVLPSGGAGGPSSQAPTVSDAPSVLGTESSAPVVGGTDDQTPAATEEASVLGVEAQAAPGAAAPTAVAAGRPGVLQAVHARATSPLGAVLVTSGLLLAGTAVAVAARRRRGLHQY